jgi:hypothetical protein
MGPKHLGSDRLVASVNRDFREQGLWSGCINVLDYL